MTPIMMMSFTVNNIILHLIHVYIYVYIYTKVHRSIYTCIYICILFCKTTNIILYNVVLFLAEYVLMLSKSLEKNIIKV